MLVSPFRCPIGLLIFALAAACFFSGRAGAIERAVIRRGGGQATIEGRIVVEAADKSFLLQEADGRLWDVKPDEVILRESDDRPFEPLSAEAAAAALLKKIPAGFEVHHTKHYAICYNSNKAYAQWAGALFERLHRAFHTFWTGKGFKLSQPEFPLVAVVFADEASYAAYVEGAYGKGVSKLIAFYALSTNHITLYDLTGVGALRREGNRRGNAAQINAMLSHEDAASNVATVVHEAFHQLQFNCGLSQRYADVPLWVAEGLAMYFETPDLASAQGWRTIGAVSYGRLGDFRSYLAARPEQSLLSLVVDDRRFRDARQGRAAYAEAWALNHLLLQRHGKKYAAYLRTIAAKKPAVVDDPQTRLAELEEALGPLSALDADLLKHVKSLR